MARMTGGSAPLQLRLELDREAVSGRVSSNGGPAHRFSGYAGLIAALESIRGEQPDAPDPEAQRVGPSGEERR
jgi:hypothetical protein